jgi:uncharacterized membrane-anchored protein
MTRIAVLFAVFLAVASPLARAQDTAPQQDPAAQSAASRQQAEFQAAAQAAMAASKPGPATVPLVGQATLLLPEGYIFIPKREAGQLSRAFGNLNSTRLEGIIGPAHGGEWLAYLDYVDDGHINDDDAKSWNADDLLQTLKDGTEAANQDRAERGFPPLEVARWIEKPAYDSAAHRLVWSALVRNKGNTEDAGSANYNTYALGRSGHFELNFVAQSDKIEAHKGDVHSLLAALNFDAGQRYEDYNAATDKTAAYGLAALVGGVAAKKLGLLALMAGLFAKFFKLIAIAAVAFCVGVKKFLGRRPAGNA